MDKYKNKKKYYKKRDRKYSNNDKSSYKNKNYKESNNINEPNKFQKYYYNGENNESDYSYYDFECQQLKNKQNSQQMLNSQILNNQLPNPSTNNQIGNNIDNNQMGNNQMVNNQMGNNQMGNNQMGNNQMGNNQMGNNQMGNFQMGNNYNRQIGNNLMSNMVNHQIGNHMNNNHMNNHQMGNRQMGNNQMNNQQMPNYQINNSQQINHQLNNHQLNNLPINNQINNSMISNNQMNNNNMINNNQINNSPIINHPLNNNNQMNNIQINNNNQNNRHINNLINKNVNNTNNLNMNNRPINNIFGINNEINNNQMNNNQNNFQVNNQIKYKSENNMNNSINYQNNISINSKNKIDSRNNINDIKEPSQLVTDKKEYTPKNNNYYDNPNISKNNFDNTTNYNDNNSNNSNNINKNSMISNNNNKNSNISYNNKNSNISYNNKNSNISYNNKNSNISYNNKNSSISYNNNSNISYKNNSNISYKNNSNISYKNNPDNKNEKKEELRKIIHVDNNNRKENEYINYAILSKYVDNINRIYFTKMRFKNYTEFIEDETEIKETIYEGIYKCKKDKIFEGSIISDKLGELQIEKNDLNRILNGSKVRFILYKLKKSIIKNYNKDKNKIISLKIEEKKKEKIEEEEEIEEEIDLDQENNEDLVETKIENENLDKIDSHSITETNKDNLDIDNIRQSNELENNDICESKEYYKDSNLEENSKKNISENSKINNDSEIIEKNSNSKSNFESNVTLFNNDSTNNLNNKDDEIFIYKPRVINVVNYNLDKIVASIKIKKNKKYLIINYLKNFPEFQISNINFLKNVNDIEKKYFICEFSNWPTSSNLPYLKINNELGYYNDFNNELESIITNYKLPIQIYNEDMNLSIKEKFSYLFHDENNFRFKKDNFSNERVNLINKYIFSIDPKNATDLDDAISIETLENQNYLIGIHISDVNYFIKKGDEVDNIAKKMTTSFYFPLKKYDMLPKEFSSNLCSLNELNDKFAISIFLEFDKDSLKIINTELKKSIINVVKNLTYKEAEEIYKNHKNEDYKEKFINIEKQNKLLSYNKYYEEDDNLKIIEKTDEGLINNLVNIFELGNRLKEKRENSTIFDIKSRAELFFEFDKFNIPSSYEKIQRLESMDLIEELMIRANHEVAKILIKHNPENTILRNQEVPNNQNKLKLVNSILTHYKLFDMSDFDITKPHDYNKLIYLISIDNEFIQVEKEFLLEKLKSIFNSAAYINSSENDEKLWKHSNMNFTCYTHFTSPIRRYVDILVHREIYAILENNLDDYNNYYDKNKINTMLIDINNNKSLCRLTEMLSNNLCLFSIKNNKFNTFALIMDNPGKEYVKIFIQDIKYELKLYFKNLILQKSEIINEEKVVFYEYRNVFKKKTYFIQLKKYDIIPVNIIFNSGSGKKEFFEVNFEINQYLKSNS